MTPSESRSYLLSYGYAARRIQLWIKRYGIENARLITGNAIRYHCRYRSFDNNSASIEAYLDAFGC